MHHGNLTHEGNYFSSLTDSSNDTDTITVAHLGRTGSTDVGYLTTAFGSRHMDDAEALCKTIRYFGDTTPFAVITSDSDANGLENKSNDQDIDRRKMVSCGNRGALRSEDV